MAILVARIADLSLTEVSRFLELVRLGGSTIYAGICEGLELGFRSVKVRARTGNSTEGLVGVFWSLAIFYVW